MKLHACMYTCVLYVYICEVLYKYCTSEQFSDISIFRLVLVPKELLNNLLGLAVVMNLIMYAEK